MLATKAFNYLPCPDAGKRDAILAKLRVLRVCGCRDVPEHLTDMNHHMDPVVTKTATIPTIPTNNCNGKPKQVPDSSKPCSDPGSFCPADDIRHEDHPDGSSAQSMWAADSCNSISCSTIPLTNWQDSGMGNGYADLIALEILNYKNRGMATDDLWNNLLGKWDGLGLNDSIVAKKGLYDIYKLALFKMCARILNKTGQLPTGVDAKIVDAQIKPADTSNNNLIGGFRTQYNTSSQYTDSNGNCETTSLVVLAYLKPVSDF
jgi:hypothetical protein